MARNWPTDETLFRFKDEPKERENRRVKERPNETGRRRSLVVSDIAKEKAGDRKLEEKEQTKFTGMTQRYCYNGPIRLLACHPYPNS